MFDKKNISNFICNKVVFNNNSDFGITIDSSDLCDNVNIEFEKSHYERIRAAAQTILSENIYTTAIVHISIKKSSQFFKWLETRNNSAILNGKCILEDNEGNKCVLKQVELKRLSDNSDSLNFKIQGVYYYVENPN